MGYNTCFEGGIKITPRPSDELITKLNIYLSLRHHKGLACPKCKDLLPCDVNGLKIPDPQTALDATRRFFGLSEAEKDYILSVISIYEPAVSDNVSVKDYNTPEEPEMSLYSDIRIYADRDTAYLAWDESEKAYKMDKWLKKIIDLLASLNFTCEGVMNAYGEDKDDQWTIIVKDNNLTVNYNTRLACTYQDELTELRQF